MNKKTILFLIMGMFLLVLPTLNPAEWVENGVENYQNTVGGGDTTDATLTVTSLIPSAYVKAFGIELGGGAGDFQVHINVTGVNLASGLIEDTDNDGSVYYLNLTKDNYSLAIGQDEFTIDIHRISGNAQFQRGLNRNYSGSFFEFSDQTIPFTPDGITITYANVTGSAFNDSTSPIVNVSSPPSIFNYLYEDYNLTLNFTTVENISLIDTCLWQYNGSNSTVPCLNATSNIYYFDYEKDENNGTLFVNDTFGNLNSKIVSWDYKSFIDEIEYTTTVLEGSLQNFKINLSLNPDYQISTIDLIHNGTTYPTTFSNQNGFIIGNKDITIPDLSASGNITFYWNVTLDDDSFFNSSVYNQTVNILSIDDCSANDYVIYNFTIRDEKSQIDLTSLTNTLMEVNINVYGIDRLISILNFSNDYEDTNPALICSNVALNSNYSVDAVIKYYSEGNSTSAVEYYNILNSTLGSTNIYQNISLYALNATENTDFQLTFKDQYLALAPDILFYVQREYVSEGIYKTVEIPKTDSNGQAVLHLVRNNIRYNLIAVDSSGNILATYNNVVAFCQDYTIGSCTINLNARSTEDKVYVINEDVGISYSISYSNSTDLISMNFVSLDATTKTVRIEVTRNSDFGNRTVCSDTLASISGTLSCDTSSVSSTDRYLFVSIYVDGAFVASETIDLEDEGFNFGTEGYFIAFLIILFIITIFSDDKQTLVVSLVIGWAIVIAFGLVEGALIGSISGGIWLIITAIIFIWKLKKEETS